MIYEQHHAIANDGSYPIQAVRLSNTPSGNEDLASGRPSIEAVWAYGAWGNHVTAESFVTSVLNAATTDRQSASIWLPHEPILDEFAEDDQWARILPVVERAADSREGAVYLAPHSISVRRAAEECRRHPYIQGVVALTPNATGVNDKRSTALKIVQEGVHWRTAGTVVGNMETAASLAAGFAVRSLRHFNLARNTTQEGLRDDAVLRALTETSQAEKQTGVLLAKHDRVFSYRATLESLLELGYRGLVRSIRATHISAFVNHRNGAAFYRLWSEVVQQTIQRNDTQL